jgi:hypothetical protein
LLDQRGRVFLRCDPVRFIGLVDFHQGLGEWGKGGRAEADLIAGMTLVLAAKFRSGWRDWPDTGSGEDGISTSLL